MLCARSKLLAYLDAERIGAILTLLVGFIVTPFVLRRFSGIPSEAVDRIWSDFRYPIYVMYVVLLLYVLLKRRGVLEEY